MAGSDEGGAEEPDEESEEESSQERGWEACDGVATCSACALPCDCSLLLNLSTALRLAALLVPGRAGRRPVLALLGLYRRRLTRFTPRCPSTPSCSAHAVDAVRALGARRGLLAAARRVRDCGRVR
jgi:hypothetical protein